MIDYPRLRFAKAGSCIFLRVWENPDKCSTPCVGLPEPRVEHFQTWAKNRHTVIAILPEPAVDRLKDCLPVNTHVSRNDAPVAVPVPNPLRQTPASAAKVTSGRFEHDLERNARALRRHGLRRYFQKRS